MRVARFSGKQIVELILTVIEVVAPVFLLGAIGFGWVRMGFPYDIPFVTRLAMTLAVPALIFVSLTHMQVSPAALTSISVAAMCAYAALTIIGYGVVRALRLEIRTYLAPMIFGNTGNLGLPLALFAFGDQGLGFAVVVFAISAIWVFTLGIWLVSGGGSPLRVLREPMVLATLLGAVFLWQGWQLPGVLDNTLGLLGQMAIPLMLITLGVAVAGLKPGRLGQAVWLSLLRVGLAVVVAWAVGRWLGLGHVAFGVLVLQISTPVAVTSYLLAEKYGADSEGVAGLVVVSTLLAVVTIPLTLAFLL